MPDRAPIIAVEHLHKAYGATVAVEDVSFSARQRRSSASSGDRRRLFEVAERRFADI
ncbi:MAG TPA: hypothetical protein VMF65_05020 [Acidimicrobiales bacterium]|nr:hypothetical protein [Acidimicrobiales bacterium]